MLMIINHCFLAPRVLSQRVQQLGGSALDADHVEPLAAHASAAALGAQLGRLALGALVRCSQCVLEGGVLGFDIDVRLALGLGFGRGHRLGDWRLLHHGDELVEEGLGVPEACAWDYWFPSELAHRGLDPN